MKLQITSHRWPALGALLMALAVCAVLAQAHYVPFQGTLDSRDHGVVTGDTVTVTGAGAGIASHIGRFTYTYQWTAVLGSGHGSGVIQLVAANGDVIDGSFVGRAEPTDTPNLTHVTELVTITGGTGRFQGATGGFKIDLLLDESNLPTGVTSGSFTGTISTPAPAR
jgi:hypothetical protein